MSLERRMQKMGPIGEVIAVEYRAGKSRAEIKREKGFTTEQATNAIGRLEKRGFFSEFPQEEVRDWIHPPGPSELVRRELTKGTGRLDLPAATGLRKDQISGALNWLQSRNEYREPSDKLLSEAQMDAQNSLRPIIEPYAFLRMTAAQIVIAARIGSGVELEHPKVQRSLTGAIQSSQSEVHRRNEEELKLGRTRFHRETPEQLERNVRLWLDSAALLLTDRAADPWPNTMNEWAQTYEAMHEQGLVSEEMHNWQNFVQIVEQGGQKLRTTEPDFVAAYKNSLATIKRYEQRKKIQHARDAQYLTREFGIDTIAKNDADWAYAMAFLRDLDGLIAEAGVGGAREKSRALKGTEVERKEFARILLLHGMYIRHAEVLTGLEDREIEEINTATFKQRIRPPKDMQMEAHNFQEQKAVVQTLLDKNLITDDVFMRRQLEEVHAGERARSQKESGLPDDIVDDLLLEVYHVGIARNDPRYQIAYAIAKKTLGPSRNYLSAYEQLIRRSIEAMRAQRSHGSIVFQDPNAGVWEELDIEDDRISTPEVRTERQRARERNARRRNVSQEEGVVDEEP